MAYYKKMYHTMFNAVTDIINLLESALDTLKKAQLDCEEIYTQAGNGDQLIALPDSPNPDQ